MVENIGGEIFGSLPTHLSRSNFGCWKKIRQNIISIWKRGEAVGNCCSRCCCSHFFLQTLQAASIHFEMKSLKIRDLLHLCQSSLGIIERNNLPNASLVGNSRNLSSESLSRPVAALYWQKVRFVSKVNREHVIDWVKTQWRLFSQVNDM